MICFWNNQALTRFEQIDHKFLVRGHTYLPNDRDFAHIEKRKGSACVYVPGDREEVREACPKKPFDVKPMELSEFFKFCSLVQQYTHRKKDAKKKPVLISNAVWMNFGQGEEPSGKLEKHPNHVWLRYTYSKDEPWSKVCLLKERKKRPPSEAVLMLKYPQGHPIKTKKLDDLECMIPFLPEEHRKFYTDLCDSATSESLDNSEDDSDWLTYMRCYIVHACMLLVEYNN